MTPTVEHLKVEIIFDAPLVETVTDIVMQAGAGGYTIIPALSGSGRSGRWSEDLVSAADTRMLLLTIATDDVATEIVNALEPLLDSYGMIVITSRVGVVRVGRF